MTPAATPYLCDRSDSLGTARSIREQRLTRNRTNLVLSSYISCKLDNRESTPFQHHVFFPHNHNTVALKYDVKV